MAATFTGTTLGVERDEIVIDPIQGRVRVIEWHGDKASIFGLIPGLTNTGAVIRTTQQGPMHILVATYQTLINGPETPTDRWTIATEPLQKSGFFHPLVNAEMEADSNPADYRKGIEDAVTNGDTDATLDANGYLGDTIAHKMFLELRRQADSYEDEYIILRLTRQISTLYTTKLPIGGNGIVYQSSQLPVPNAVFFTLPTFGSSPAQSNYGWRLRTRQSDFVGAIVVQTLEWVFAAWSSLYYTTAASAFVI